MNEQLGRFLQSAHDSAQFSTTQLRRLHELALKSGSVGELAAVFTASYPDLTAKIDFFQSVTDKGYRVLEELGQGGMAVIFRVYNQRANREEALKLFQPGAFADDKQSALRFRREIHLLRTAQNKNLVPIYEDHETAKGNLYFTMELLRGATLRDLIARHGPMPVSVALAYLEDIVDGLSALHNLQLVHRDVKPSNIFIKGPENILVKKPENHVVLLDLGIAGLAAGHSLQGHVTLTHENTSLGTHAYSSYRQLTNPRQVDPSDDVYSLGCVLYYMLTGGHAFGEEVMNVQAAAAAHSQPVRPFLPRFSNLQNVSPLKQLPISHEVNDFFRKMIELNPNERFPNARAVAHRLRELRSGLADPQIEEFLEREANERQPLEDKKGKLAGALDAYLSHLRDKQLKVSLLPLVRARNQTLAKMKDVFVPIDVRTIDAVSDSDNTHDQLLAHESAPVSAIDRTKESRRNAWQAKPSSQALDLGDTSPRTDDSARPTRRSPQFDKTDPSKGNSELGALLFKKRRVVLLGPPGGGKSTMLRRAALAFAEARGEDLPGWQSAWQSAQVARETNRDGEVRAPNLPGWQSSRVPIFLYLKSFAAYLQGHLQANMKAESCHLIDYLQQFYRVEQKVSLPEDFFHRLLKAGDCAVFMDGLDEVQEDFQKKIAEQVNIFVSQYGQPEVEPQDAHVESERNTEDVANVDRLGGNLFVLSSRPKGYESVKKPLQSARFAICEVKTLELPRIRELLHKVLRVIEPDTQKRNRDFAKLSKDIENSRELTILCGTPMFCTSLVLVAHRGAELPKRRVDVLDNFLSLLLGYWNPDAQSDDKDGIPANFELGAKVTIRMRRLSYLAKKMQDTEKKDGGLRTEIKFSFAARILAKYLQREEKQTLEDAKEFAKQFLIKSQKGRGILKATERGVYAFAHEGFREYLVAHSLINLGDREFIHTVIDHIDKATWEEIILLAASHPALPDKRREYLLNACQKAAKNAVDANPELWVRLMIMTGRMAYDMGEYLSPNYRAKLEAALRTATTNSIIKLSQRIDLALALDGLGRPPDTQFGCTKIVEAERHFYIGTNLVANRQYQRFLDDKEALNGLKFWKEPYCVDCQENKYSLDDESLAWFRSNSGDKRRPASWNDSKFGTLHRTLPVVGVSWFEANAYCRWLEENWSQLDEAKVNPDVHPTKIRLPTEREWHLAVFGSSHCQPQPWESPFPPATDDASSDSTPANNLTKYANIGKALDRTSPVGMFADGVSNPYKLVDTLGNVWEWQANYFDWSFRALALRGGAYTTSAADVDRALRGCREPTGRDTDVGFRILIEV